jgi:hypothetical protein
VTLEVSVPTSLTAEQRGAVEDLGRSLGSEAYARRDEDEGFFRRLKNALR